jgi:uncharacterized membrane protein (UPF0127 family)
MNNAVINKTRQTILVSDLEVAKTGWQRMRGLIGRSARNFYKGKGLLLLSCEGVHTIGMAFPIDVAYLDSDDRVVHMYQNLRPFRVGKVKRRANSVLELPTRVLAESRTEVGDHLQFLISEEKEE